MNAPRATDAEPKPPTFDTLPLSPDVKRAVADAGYEHPTPVQLAVFEPATRGRNLVVQARTGTGKTAAFGLPIVDSLVRKSLAEVQALVLTPTRELALQVCAELDRLAKHKGLRAVPIYGGAPMGAQVEALKNGAQIVVGTPGRVLDHLRRGTLVPKSVRIFVLDEADEMLSMGFAKELNAIVETLPSERQGLYFSATIPPDIERLAHAHLKDPEWIALSSDQVGALEIKHFTYVVANADKRETLMRVLDVEDPESAIVFCNTKDETERLAEALQNRGYDAASLNGDMDQREREKVMTRTREGKLRFLVATDVAARGIDVSHVTHVINFDFPESTEAYVHRTGRTGRAGRTGTAISLVGPKDLGNLYLLRLTYKIRPIERSLPTTGELRTREEADLVNLFLEAFSDEPSAEDLSLARRLLTHDRAEAVIAGLLRGYLGAKATDPRVAAGEARRAKNPPPVEAPKREAPPARPEPRAARERPRDTPIETEKSPDLSTRSGRRGVPHSEFASWEPPAEKDDDQPILTERGGPVASQAAPSAPAAEPRVQAPVPAQPPRGRGPRDRDRDRDRDRRGPRDRAFLDSPPETQPFRTPDPIMPGITVSDAEPERTPAPQKDVEDDPSFAQLFLNIGRRDGLRPGDVQRLLVEIAHIADAQQGRIRMRERITFVSVRPEELDRAITSLAGHVVAGRTLVAERAKPRAE
jgi:ATP-dependent RNA helicase DeaD